MVWPRNPGERSRARRCSAAGLHFPYGATVYKSFVWHLSQLQWDAAGAQHAGAGITWAELAIDNDISTGVNAPPPLHALVAAGFPCFDIGRRQRPAAIPQHGPPGRQRVRSENSGLRAFAPAGSS